MVQPEAQGLGEDGCRGVVHAHVAAGRAAARSPAQQRFPQLAASGAGRGLLVGGTHCRQTHPPGAVGCVGYRCTCDRHTQVAAECQLAVDDGGRHVEG